MFLKNIFKLEADTNSGIQLKEDVNHSSSSQNKNKIDRIDSLINPVKYDSNSIKTNLQKFQEYVEKVEKNSEKAKTRLMKIREKCFDLCTTEEFEAFEKEVLKSLDYALKPRPSLKKKSGGTARYSILDINSNHEGIVKKKSLKMQRNSFVKKLNDSKFNSITKNVDHLGKYLNSNKNIFIFNQYLAIAKKQNDNKPLDNLSALNYKTNIADRISINITEGELIKKIEKNLKNTELFSAKNRLSINQYDMY